MSIDDDIPDIAELHESLQTVLANALQDLQARSSASKGRPGVNGLSPDFANFFKNVSKAEEPVVEVDASDQEPVKVELPGGNSDENIEEGSEDGSELATLQDVLECLNSNLFLSREGSRHLEMLGIDHNFDDEDEEGTEYAIETAFFANEHGKEIGQLTCEYEDQVTVRIDKEQGTLIMYYMFVHPSGDAALEAEMIIPIGDISLSLRTTNSRNAAVPDMIALVIDGFQGKLGFKARSLEENEDEEVGDEEGREFLEVDDWTWGESASKSSKLVLYGETVEVSRFAFHLGLNFKSLYSSVFGEKPSVKSVFGEMDYRDNCDTSDDGGDDGGEVGDCCIDGDGCVVLGEKEPVDETETVELLGFNPNSNLFEPIPLSEEDLLHEIFNFSSLSLQEGGGDCKESPLDDELVDLLVSKMSVGGADEEFSSESDFARLGLDEIELDEMLNEAFEWTEEDQKKISFGNSFDPNCMEENCGCCDHDEQGGRNKKKVKDESN